MRCLIRFSGVLVGHLALSVRPCFASGFSFDTEVSAWNVIVAVITVIGALAVTRYKVLTLTKQQDLHDARLSLLEREVLKGYVPKEDWVRTTQALDAKIDKLFELLLNGRNGREN